MKKPPPPSMDEAPDAGSARATVPPPEPKDGAPLARPAPNRHAAISERKDTGFRPGDVCGDYEILGVLAAGGMGVVYKAKGRFGGKIVALKCVKPEYAERPDLLERFETEIRILAQLKHRYIVLLLHAGSHEGNLYLVMEWLDGVTLRDFMNHRGKRLDLAPALLYSICIAEALVAAHKWGVLHRDLKPENVFMEKRGENRGKVKLLDFGLGKLIEGNRVSTSERLGMMCTPHYAAPEQFDRTGVDERTDVYAAALIFVEMATGVYPFSDSPGVLPPKDVAQANQLLAEPNSLRVLLPDCPKSLTDLLDLVDAALSKDKDKRPTSREWLAGLRAARSALGKETGVALPAMEDEDSVDEPAPPAPPAESEPQNDTSVVRRLPQVMTDILPPGYEPKDPSSHGNTGRPPSSTERLLPPAAPPRASEQSFDDGSAATQSAWMIPGSGADTTNGGRSATLPPEMAEPAVPTEVAPTPPEPLAPPSAMASPASLTPAVPDDSAARASMEFASRPTVPRAPVPGNGPASLTPAPTHHGVPVLRAPPLWAGPAFGLAAAVVVFVVVLLVRSHPHDGARGTASASEATSASGAQARSPSTTLPEPSTPPGVIASAPSTQTPQAPTVTASPVPAEPPTPSAVPIASAKPAPPVAQSAPPVPVPAPTGTPARAPLSARATAPAATAPPAAAPPPSAPPAAAPPPSAPPAAAHRLFGSEQ